MNVCDCHVMEVLSEPYYEYEKWWVKCRLNSHGMEYTSTLMFNTIQGARSIKIGDIVQE